MKKTLVVLSLLVLGAVAAQANLVVNGGFEDVSTSPWVGWDGAVISINTTSANSGSQSGQVGFPSADFSNLRQEIAITPADRLLTYKLSFSVNVEGYSELLGIQAAVGEWNGLAPIVFQYAPITWVASGTTGWITISQEFTMTEADATTFHPAIFYYPQGGPPKVAGAMLVDDVSLEVVIPDPNLLVNGGFENPTVDPWLTENGAAVSITNVSLSGSQSGLVDFPDADFGAIVQWITPTEAERTNTYTLSFSVNVEETGYSEILGVRPFVSEFNGVDWVWHDGDFEWVDAGTTGWVTYSQNFTMTEADAQYFRVFLYYYPQGGPPKVAGSVLMDDINFQKATTPFPEVVAPNLLVNGDLTQSTNEVDYTAGAVPGWWTVDGSLSDWTGFWGKFADLTGWTHYHADPNIPGVATEIGTTNNPSLVADGAGFTLDGTDKFNTDFNVNTGILNLNSSGGYRNGMMQTLSGVTIDPATTYDLTVDVKKTQGHDHDNATFTLAMTSGSGVDATNLANVVTDGLLQIAVTNLTTSFAPQTIQLSGADLTGQLNVLIENLNTEIIPDYPFVDPGDVTNPDNVSQVTIDRIALTLPVYSGDVDKDGFITWNDVDLANSYLDGSIDGGDDAVTRQNTLIAQGSTSAEALAKLNLVDFDINGDDYFDAADVTALEALVPPMVIDSGAMDGSGNFVVEVSGLRPGTTNYLMRSTDLLIGSFPDVVDSVTPVGSEATMMDTSPPAGEAFYQVTE